MTTPGFCSHCNAQSEPGDNYCQACGAEFTDVAATPFRPGFPGHYDFGDASPPGVISDPGVVPGELASMRSRTGAWAITNPVVGVISYIPFVGLVISLVASLWSLVLFRRGQDVGARILGLRVIRDTGELAGFYHMWTRTLASLISLIVIGAGFWTAYTEPDRRTWHDRWLGTYVVKAGPEVDNLPGTSSSAAKTWFWVSIAFSGSLLLLTAFLAEPSSPG